MIECRVIFVFFFILRFYWRFRFSLLFRINRIDGKKKKTYEIYALMMSEIKKRINGVEWEDSGAFRHGFFFLFMNVRDDSACVFVCVVETPSNGRRGSFTKLSETSRAAVRHSHYLILVEPPNRSYCFCSMAEHIGCDESAEGLI